MAESSNSHYQVLRVAVTATDKEIKVAYRRAARKAHPDHGGEAEMFRRVTLAYETLIDPKRRDEYDRRYAERHFRTAPKRVPATHCGAPGPAPAQESGVLRPRAIRPAIRPFTFPPLMTPLR